jgi:predicted dehydrogenase
MVEAALRAGKHVLVEKPLALSVADADRLVSVADETGLVLMAGHTFLYNPSIRYVKRLLDGGELGSLLYMYSQRLNLGQIRTDVDAWWNLAPHDVSIFLYLRDGVMPVAVAAQGKDYVQQGVADVVFATLRWADGVLAHTHVSWLDPGKVRRVTVVGDAKMAVCDDVSDDKVAVLDRGISRVPTERRMDFDDGPTYTLVQRSGDVWMPRVAMQEPLRVEAIHFLECIRTGVEPITGPVHARNVVAVLEAGEQSLRSGGAETQVRC